MVQPASKRLVTEAAGAVAYATASQGAKADASAGVSPEFAALGAALGAGQQSVAVQIIGDSTGNGTDEWVHLTAQWLATKYPAYRVTHRIWDPASQDYLAPIVIQPGPAGERYLIGDGVARAVCVPTTAANTITGDIDIRVDVSLDSWTATGEQVLVSKYGSSGNRTFRFHVSSFAGNKPQIEWSPDGTTLLSAVPSTFTIPADGTRKWLRVTLDVDNGASGRTIRFYDSTDGVTWTQIGTDVVQAGVTSLYNSTIEWQVAARGGYLGGGLLSNGKFYHVEARNGIDGPTVIPAKPEAWSMQNTAPAFGGSPTLTFINGSESGASLTYLLNATRFQKMTPDYGQVLAIVSCSHNDGARTGVTYLPDWDTMLTNLRTKLPLAGVAVCTQNPRIAPAAQIREHAIRASQILGWASRNRVGVIDAFRRFSEDPRGLSALVNTTDGIHPVLAGSQLWSSAAQSVITGR
jgi:hypothetical protein